MDSIGDMLRLGLPTSPQEILNLRRPLAVLPGPNQRQGPNKAQKKARRKMARKSRRRNRQ